MKNQTQFCGRRRFPHLLLMAALAATLSGGFTAKAADPGPADLKRLCEELHTAITSGDEAKAGKITLALLPDKARIQKALSDKVSPDVLQKIVTFHSSLPREPQPAARLLTAKPEQKNVMVHAATTEEIAKYAPGTPPYEEFPGATKDLAQQGVLRPGMTFYEVEFLEPGQKAGMKYHLFYWDGNGWAMLGPIWRALK